MPVIQPGGGSSSLTIGTTSISGGTLNDALSVGAGGVLQNTAVNSGSGSNTIVVRDSNGKASATNFIEGFNIVTAAAGTTVMTAASVHTQYLSGATTQTFQLPNATTLTTGEGYLFINSSTGTLTINNAGGSPLFTIASGGTLSILLDNNSTSNGAWVATTQITAGSNGLYSSLISSIPTQANTGFTTWLNQPSGSSVSNIATGMSVFNPNQSSVFTPALLDFTSPGTTPYSFTALIGCTQDVAGNGFACFGWSDGSKFQGHFFGGQLTTSPYQKDTVGHISSLTSGTFTQDSAGSYPTGTGAQWFKIRDDGTNVHFSIGSDGVNFQDEYSVAKASGALSSYSHIAFGASSFSGSGGAFGTLLAFNQGT